MHTICAPASLCPAVAQPGSFRTPQTPAMRLTSLAAVIAAIVAFAPAARAQMPERTTPPEPTAPLPATNLYAFETSLGRIVVRLFDETPLHRDNFKRLVQEAFYDSTTFHRVIQGFMIQGGDPNTKDPKASRDRHGTGGPGHTVKAEFNDTPHRRGVLSMARSSDPNSAGSQFFICVKDSNFLDRQYTAFGRVVRGMEVADKIAAAPRDNRDNPHERVEMKVRVVPSAP